jgi:tetratricopeptide (TPR) repeat protein
MRSVTKILLLILCAAPCYAASSNSSYETDKMQDSLVQLAARCYSEGDYKRTISLKATADSLSRSSKLLFYQGMSYTALYDYPHAIASLQQAINGDSANVNYRFQYGRLLIQAGFLERAADELSSCILLDSTYLPAWYQLGFLCNMQKTNLKKEYEIFSFLIRQNPDDFLSLYYLGDVLRRSDLPDSGITFIQRSLVANPHYYPSLIAYAYYCESKKQYAPALDLFKQALDIRPHDKDLLFQTGECLRKSGAPNEAVAYFNQSIAIDSTNEFVHAQLGYAYYSLGKFDSSVQAYARAIALNDDNADYYKNTALAYLKMDSVEAAIQMSKKSIGALHPENIAFATSNLASIYTTKKMSHDAIGMYKKNIADAYLNLATYYHSNNMRADAIAMYQRVIEFDPAQELLLLRMARLYEEMNDNKAAIDIYKKLTRLVRKEHSIEFQKRIEFLQKKINN